MRHALVAVAAALLAALAGGLPAAADAAPRYRTPGYEGRTKVPRTRLPATPPARPVELSPAGRFPDVHVDSAGTAHIVWSEDDGAGPDVVRYCRLRRAARTCDNPPATQRLVWSKSYGPGDDPRFDVDQTGPRIVVIGDQIVLLSYRYPTAFEKPDGSDPSRTLLAWVSDDGGERFSGPAVVGNAEIGGGAVAFGSDDDPTILVIDQTSACQSCVQAIRPGQFTSARGSLGAPGADQAYWGSLALDGGMPVAAFADLRRTTLVRRWSGSGSPADPATWSAPLAVPGDEPQLAGGPSGLFLMNKPDSGGAWMVRRLASGGAGRAVAVSDADDAVLRDLVQDPSGRLFAAWVSRGGRRPGVRLRSSTDGRAWTPAQLLLGGGGAGQLAVGATDDGGGVVALNRSGGINAVGPIAAVPIGPRTPTGRPGLGNLPGGGDAAATSGCQRITFGAVVIQSPSGCFLKGTGRNARVSVTNGEIDFNGLTIVPDPGTRILIDARAHTLDTTGPVRVLLRGPGVGEIVLYHAPLSVRLPTAAAGVAFSFPMGPFKAELKGFGIVGRIDVHLTGGGVRIPVALRLPPYLGGVTGQAVLVADARRGLHLDSLVIDVAQAPIGPVLIRDLHIAYDGGGERWDGRAALLLPPQPGGARLDATVVFAGGAFREGSLVLTPPFPPGLPVAPGVYLSRIGGGVALDPLALTLTGQLGAIPLTPRGPFTATVDGRATVTFADPVRLEFTGTGSLLDVALTEQRVVADTSGYASLRATSRYDLGIVAGSGSLDGTFDGPRRQFLASIRGDLVIAGEQFHGVEALASSAGFGGCYRLALVALGFGYRWGGTPEVLFPSCDLSAYRPAQGGGGTPQAPGGPASGFSFAVSAGTPTVSVQVDGDAGLPQVVLVAPGGERITPQPLGGAVPQPGARAFALPVSPTRITIGIAQPAAGTWRVEPAAGAARAGRGGPRARAAAITGARVANGFAPPTVRARVRGTGRTRTLAYEATARDGLSITFLERGRGGTRVLGRVARGGRGTLRFATGALPGGRRTVVALLTQDGIPRLRRTLSSYVAPPPPRPARPRGVALRRAGGGVLVRWRGASRANGHLVRVTVGDGRRLTRVVLGARTRSLRVGRVARRYRVTVSVAGRTRSGRLGPAAHASLRAASQRRRR